MHKNFTIEGTSPEVCLAQHPNEDLQLLLDEWESSEILKFNTSGSTGKPKPIAVSKKIIIHSAQTTCKTLDLKPGDKACLSLPLNFVAGRMMFYRSLICGFDLIPTSGRVEELLELESTIDFMALTPFQVSKILDIIPDYFFKVRKLIIGGGPLYPELESRLERFDTRVYETYGMTETVSHVALRNVHPALEGFFHALEGVHFSTDSRNCLVVHAPDWGHESLITNDVVELNSATSFVWNGRYDFVINSGGLKIHPESLEKQLKNQLSTNFFVAGVPDDLLGEKAVLVVEAEKEISIDLSVVDRYRRPKKIYYLPNFVYTPSGKINRPETLSLI